LHYFTHFLEGRVIAVTQSVFFQVRKLTFDPIEPGSVRGQKLKAHIVLPRPLKYLLGLMRRPVIQNDPESSGIFSSNGLQKTQKLLRPLAPLEMAPKFTGAHIIGRQQMANAVTTTVGRSKSFRLVLALPGASSLWPQFQRAELINADYLLAPFLRRFVKRFDSVFFTSKSGSLDSFHVFDRCKER
jgi:hypothetical protein